MDTPTTPRRALKSSLAKEDKATVQKQAREGSTCHRDNRAKGWENREPEIVLDALLKPPVSEKPVEEYLWAQNNATWDHARESRLE